MRIRNDNPNGLYLLCNREGQICEVLFDDPDVITPDRFPVQFGDIIDHKSTKKASEFWSQVIDNQVDPDVEMYLKRDQQEPVRMKFTGGCHNDEVWIIAASRGSVLKKILDEMRLINNDQQNRIRKAEKLLSKFNDGNPSPSTDLYDELSAINNELVNSQRKLVKHNQEILRLNKELADKNNELEHFSYSVSHDLKEPLRMVKAYMKLLDQRYGNTFDEKAKQYIFFAVDGAERMDVLIKDLLEYSRVGRIKNQPERIDIGELLNEIRKLNQAQIESTGGSMKWAEMPEVICRKTPMQQLFNNLISNSIKHRKKERPPEIFISFEETGIEWIFTVADNGKGIEPEYHSAIFELFRKVDDNSTSGTGMGLAICKKIVEEQGGHIWVESEPGKGSRFSFTIGKRQPDIQNGE